jgi:hypothetical protein
MVSSVTLLDDEVRIMLDPSAASRQSRRSTRQPVQSADGMALILPLPLVLQGGRTSISGAGSAGCGKRRIDKTLVAGLRRAHRELRAAGVDVLMQRPAWNTSSAVADPYLRRLVRLAFLAPDIQQAIMDGRQPSGLTLQQLRESEIPACWDEQRRRFGFAR